MRGTVIKSTGSWYEVLTDDDQLIACRIKGKLRLDGVRETNPVAVGDYIVYELEDVNGVISEVLPRKNHLLRQAVKKSGHSHILAANIDLASLLVTIKQPRTSLGFVDRFLISAEAFRIPQLLVFNKTDLLTEEELTQQSELVRLYNSLGVQSISISVINEDLSELRKLLQNKITLMAGHSGVGKSTLLNKLSPEFQQTTQAISNFSMKGTHTTTFAEMFRLDKSSFVIDTPGVKEWGLVDMEQQEISDYFIEMRALRLSCKFGSKCLHLQEPGCAIQKGVLEGVISESRYHSYKSMVLGEDNRK